MKKLKMGIIGVGRLGYEHACNIATRVPGAELVAICDGNLDRAKEVAEELGVPSVYSDPKEMCANPEVEAVAIITNTASHVDMIRIAMDAGKHVFC
ncbi:Gfo/Idh/MocA family oxidoreductase, partial [Intestinibacillus massiliensis]|nr:Gfo/Idh/MocA family oxidoreductase [Intestinibacillus massiliensis]